MNRTLLVAGAGVSIVAAGVAVGVVARAEAPILPDPGDVGPLTMAAQLQEPPTGFTGACLLDYMAYQPTLPRICYSPTTPVIYGGGTTSVTFPANRVLRPYSSAPASYDSYEVLVTCYPHGSDGACPQQAFAISRSCCDYGTELISVDGQTASGLVAFR
jgi:hypothetical protein